MWLKALVLVFSLTVGGIALLSSAVWLGGSKSRPLFGLDPGAFAEPSHNPESMKLSSFDGGVPVAPTTAIEEPNDESLYFTGTKAAPDLLRPPSSKPRSRPLDSGTAR
jgi:hypothetical protein